MNTETIITPKPILIPKDNIDFARWSVIACDQFTSQPKYWEELKNYVGGKPSTLKLILPEVYLGSNMSDKIVKINAEMQKYIDDDIFRVIQSGMILVERSTPYSKKRLGLVVAVDLEKYSFNVSENSLIRASERTILERIPPRVKIREKAPLELPHTMLLLSDPDFTVIEAAYKSEEKELIYDFELNQGGGHIKGYEVKNPQKVLESFKKISTLEAMQKTCKSCEVFCLAVGDGNHSLATAKVNWNNIKRELPESERENHPARFALVEIANLYNEGLNFHPIHRVIKNIDIKKVLSALRNEFLIEKGTTEVIFNSNETLNMRIPSDPMDAIEGVQKFLDDLKLEDESIIIDYVHGDDNLREIVSSVPDSLGIKLPPIQKENFFEALAARKVLPKKSFSIGEATEKRYYLEAKYIK